MEELLDDYIHEAGEQVEQLESKLLYLEPDTDCSDIINDVFRVIHNLKGTSGMFGFNNIVKLTHDLETVFDDLRSNTITLTKEIVDTTFEAVDFIKHLLHSSDELERGSLEKFEILVDKIMYLSGSAGKTKPSLPKKSKNATTQAQQYVYHIIFKPDKNIFRRGINLQAIYDDIIGIGQSLVFQNKDKTPLEEQIARKECLSTWDFFVIATTPSDKFEMIFMFLDASEFSINDLVKGTNWNKDELKNKILSSLEEIRNDTEELVTTFCNSIQSQNEDYRHKTRGKQQAENKEQAAEIVKVASTKLDNLMNLVSELVTSKAHLEILAQNIKDPGLLKAVEQLDKLSKRFRDNALEIRVVPLGSIVPKFKRLVHDLSQELGKKIDFIVEGADTELDKNIINSLENPLMHIIRNAADHGIENSEERIASGKEPNGLLKFVAFYSGSNVFIQIQDDGVGINVEKIKEKAINTGLITENEQLTNKDILNLIFLPGFSTAANVTDISGRGVGMDVVKKTIEELRGEIDITTEVGLGTSFTMKLPLTLSIIDTLHVAVSNISFLVPLSDVNLCDNVSESSLRKTSKDAIEINNLLVPYIDLRREFGLPDETNNNRKIIVIKKEDKRTALIVDNIIGQHQAVIKPLGHIFQNQDFLSGGSIMGDGSVALVIDTNKLSSITK